LRVLCGSARVSVTEELGELAVVALADEQRVSVCEPVCVGVVEPLVDCDSDAVPHGLCDGDGVDVGHVVELGVPEAETEVGTDCVSVPEDVAHSVSDCVGVMVADVDEHSVRVGVVVGDAVVVVQSVSVGVDEKDDKLVGVMLPQEVAVVDEEGRMERW